jgi:hypothetical protein
MPKNRLPSPESESAFRGPFPEETLGKKRAELPGERPLPVERHGVSVIREVADLKEHATELEDVETPEEFKALLEIKNIPEPDLVLDEIEQRAAEINKKFETALDDRTIFEWEKARQLAAELDAVYELDHLDVPPDKKELLTFMKQDHYQHWLERMGAAQIEKDFASIADAEEAATRAFEEPFAPKETGYTANVALREALHTQMPPEIKKIWDALPERVVRRLPELIKEKNPENQRRLVRDIRNDEIEEFKPWLETLPEEQRPEARRYITEYVWYFVGHRQSSSR